MSVIVRNNPSVGVGGSTPKGFPPGDVTNLDIITGISQVKIKWSDPEDTIIDGTTLAKWKGTILVRKEGSAPQDIKDGVMVIDNIEKNKYKDTYYIDDNLSPGNYYYRIYTYDENDIYNDSVSMIFKMVVTNVSTILSENDWDTICDVAEAGTAQNYWKIGDEIAVQLSGKYNAQVTMRIMDFNHYSGSHITFGCKNIVIYSKINSGAYSVAGNYTDWRCDIKPDLVNNILNSLPEMLRNRIKTVNIPSYTPNTGMIYTNDKIFIPSTGEIGYECCGSGNKFSIITDIASASIGADYWTRDVWISYYTDPDTGGGQSDQWYMYNNRRGDVRGTGGAENLGINFIFNI